MLTCEIPEDLAREAIQFTDTHEEAERYVLDRADEIHLVWPDDLGVNPQDEVRAVQTGGQQLTE